MVNLIQKEDLRPQDFSNNDTNAAGGIGVRRTVNSSVYIASQPRVGTQDPRGEVGPPAVPVFAAPAAGDNPFYVRQARVVAGEIVRPASLWFWDATLATPAWVPQSGILDIRNDGPIYTAYNGADEPVNAWFGEQIDPDDPPVILNNPIIYVRRDTGQANPPIETQADLTIANAFNNMNSVRAFMNRANVIGTVTIDARGDYSAAGQNAAGDIGPAQFKNAQNIVVRGDPADPTALKFPWGDTNRNYGFVATGGNIIARDMTLVCGDTSTNATANTTAAFVANGALLRLAGTIRFEGSYTRLRPGASGAYLVYPGASGEVRMELNTTFEFAMTGSVNSVVQVPSSAQFTVQGNTEFDIQAPLEIRDALVFLASGGNLNIGVTPPAPNMLAVTGPARFVAPASVRVSDLGIAFAAGYGSRNDFITYDFGADVAAGGAQSVMNVFPVGVVNNQAGP